MHGTWIRCLCWWVVGALWGRYSGAMAARVASSLRVVGRVDDPRMGGPVLLMTFLVHHSGCWIFDTVRTGLTNNQYPD